MNTYQAIHTAATLLEEHPEYYTFFGGSEVPDGDNDPNCKACLLSWIGYYLDEPPGTECGDVADKYFPFIGECMNRPENNEGGFYEYFSQVVTGPGWWNRVEEFPHALRRFAEEYKGEFPDVK